MATLMSSCQECGQCYFWNRIAHMFDYELGRCELFEREMNEHSACGMFEARAVQSNIVNIADHVTNANET
jgi:threonine aldolase